MTNRQIAELISRDKTYYSICRKIARSKDLADDLLQHIILLVLEGKAGNIEAVYKAGNLKWYFVRLCTNQYNSTCTSTFSREMKHFEPVLEYLPIEQEINEPDEFEAIFEKEYNQTIQYLNETGWYNAKLFELYLEVGSIRKLSKQTKIPVMSIFNSIKQTREYVLNRFNGSTPNDRQLELGYDECISNNQTAKYETIKL